MAVIVSSSDSFPIILFVPIEAPQSLQEEAGFALFREC